MASGGIVRGEEIAQVARGRDLEHRLPGQHPRAVPDEDGAAGRERDDEQGRQKETNWKRHVLLSVPVLRLSRSEPVVSHVELVEAESKGAGVSFF